MTKGGDSDDDTESIGSGFTVMTSSVIGGHTLKPDKIMPPPSPMRPPAPAFAKKLPLHQPLIDRASVPEKSKVDGDADAIDSSMSSKVGLLKLWVQQL